MISNEALKALLAESKAEFVQANIWTLSSTNNVFVRRWLVDRSQAQDAEEFLLTYLSANHYPNEVRSIANPWASGQREGVYRAGRVMAKLEVDPQTQAEEWFVYQELRKGFVQTVMSGDAFDFSEFSIDEGRLLDCGSRLTTLRLSNVDPAFVEEVKKELQTSSSYADMACKYGVVSGENYYLGTHSRQDDDGSATILLTVMRVPDNPAYIVSGKKKTVLTDEEDRLYRGIPVAYVTTMINGITTLGNYVLISSDATKTSEDGVFDVRITLRTLLVPPGGLDVLIGYTGGMFRTQVRMLRNVKDADLEGTVTALSQTSLIENVRATGGREDGVWDIVYSQLLVPATHVDRYEYYERQQNRREDTDYNYFFKWVPYISNVVPKNTNPETYTLTNDYQKQVDRVPTAFKESSEKQFRKVSVQKTISYGATFNNVSYPNSSVSYTTTTSGKTFQLSNGIWQKEVEAVTYDWWPDPVRVSPVFT